MRFLLEIIFCVGAAYGVAWCFSSYYRPVAHQAGNFNGLRQEKRKRAALALVSIAGKRLVQPGKTTGPVRPARDKNWLS